MPPFFICILTATVLTLSLAAAAAVPSATPAPGGGTPVTSDAWRDAMLSRAGEGNEFGRASAGESGVVLTTDKLAANEFKLEVSARTIRPLQRGQPVLLRFAARSLQSADMTGQTQLGVFFQKASPDWYKSIHTYVMLNDTWQRFDIPFKVRGDYAPDEAGLYFSFGFAPQVAEIADVQLIAYPMGTDLSTLPRTQRPIGEPDPELYKQTIPRIAKFRAALNERLKREPSGADRRTLHVAADAAAGGDGSEDRPFNTIRDAVNVAQPGDTVLVAGGVYDKYTDAQAHTHVKLKGTPDAWIVIAAAPGARPKIVSPAWSAFRISGSQYVEIRGFEIEGVLSDLSKQSGNGIGIIDRSTHIRVIDNIVHNLGGGGIYAMKADYVHIEGNTVFGTSHGSDWGNSGISLYQCINSDDADGYKNIIRRNICYRNENLKPFRFGGGSITDGNGIIVDDNRHTQNKSKDTPYQGWTLIENNLIYNNGGRAIHSYLSDRIDVINNTTYRNQHSKDIRNGELTAIRSEYVSFFNNIVVPNPEARANAEDRSAKIIFGHNLYYNTDDYLAGREAIAGRDPLFESASLDATSPQAFAVKPTSPAIDAALADVAPADDLFGRPRSGKIDLGAIESSGE